jgi:hypothetical protein
MLESFIEDHWHAHVTHGFCPNARAAPLPGSFFGHAYVLREIEDECAIGF